MKICFITDTIFSLGGIQRVVSVIASKLAEDYDVDVLCTQGNFDINRELYNLNEKVNINIKEELVKKNINIKVISKLLRVLNERTGFLNKKKYINILTKAYYPKKTQEKFIKHINENEYDIVIGVAGYYSLLLGIISHKLNSKVIGWQHNSYDAYLRNKGIYHWNQDELFKEYLNKLDSYIVLTDDDKKQMKKYLHINCKRIYNPLSFTSEDKSKCVNKNILCVGRLVKEQKGFDLLIKAFNKVVDNHKDWKLKIVGDGPDKEEILQLINELNLNDEISIEPFTKNIKEKYLESSIFVSSSRWEGFGLVITEAMECGLPVVAFDNSGPKEIINKPNENGILVPCGDICELSKAMLSLMNDNEKRKILSYGAIKRAEEFNINSIICEWEKLFNDVSELKVNKMKRELDGREVNL